jgi:hypothetical protein
MDDLGGPLPADAHADDVDTHFCPTAVLAGQPQPGQPAQPPHLVRCHRLGHATELVTGARLHLDEHHDTRCVVSGNHIQLAVPAAPVAGQHSQTDRLQVINCELLTHRADLGAGQRSHGPTVQRSADKPRCAADKTARPGRVLPSRDFIHNSRTRGFVAVKNRVHGVMTDNPIHGAVDRATDSDALETAARAGFAVSGMLHLLVAYIMLQIALGSGGSADKSGALATLGGQTGGAVMLWLAAAGLVALGLWHVAEVIIGPHPGEHFGRDDGHSHMWERLKAAGLALMYFVIAFSAAKFAIGSGKSDTAQQADMTARLMQSGWGKAVVVLVGLAVIGVGGYHVYKGATKRFLKDLRVTGGDAVTATGVVGYVAKGGVFAIAGVLVIVAVLQADPTKSTGLDGAVKALGAAPFGQVLLILAAAGIAAYGAYSFVRSRCARM